MSIIQMNNLPPSWTTAKLVDILSSLESGSRPKGGVKGISEGIPSIGGEHLSPHGKFKFGNIRYIPEAFAYKMSKGLIKENDLLVVKDGATTAKVSFVDKTFPYKKAFVNEHVFICRVSEQISPKIIFWYLWSQEGQKRILANFKGSAQGGITTSFAQNTIIPLPPLPEQHRIVAKLEELFSQLDIAVEALRKAKQQIKAYKQAVLAAAFSGKLTIDNSQLTINEETGLPEGWKFVRLKDITNGKDGLRRGPFGSSIKKEFFVETGYKVYEQGNAINDDPYRGKYFINEDKYQELINFMIVPHDLIVSCSGVTLGRITEIPSDGKPGIINQALLRIRLKKEIISNKFFIIYFRSAFFQKKIFSQSQGSAMPNLVGIKDFREIELLVPPISEQEQIVAEIETRFSEAENLEKTIDIGLEQAESLRQSILKKAFEGRLVPQDPNDEPASVLLERIKRENK